MVQADTGTIALLLYTAGVFVQAIRFPKVAETAIGKMQEYADEEFKLAHSVETDREEALEARERYETFRDRRAEFKAMKEHATDFGFLSVISLLFGLIWPVVLLTDLFKKILDGIWWIHERFSKEKVTKEP